MVLNRRRSVLERLRRAYRGIRHQVIEDRLYIELQRRRCRRWRAFTMPS